MARSIEYWYNLLVTEKQTFNELNGLMPEYDLVSVTPDNPFLEMLNEVASASKLAVWKCWLYIVAVGYYTLDMFWDETKVEMEEIALRNQNFVRAWYADKTMKWQYGDALIIDSTTYRVFYADSTSPAAVAKRLVKRVSVTEVYTEDFNGVVIKVTGENGKLDDAPGTEEDSLTHYINEQKPGGVQTRIVNLDSDKVRLHLRMYYDGTLILADFETLVEAALAEFLVSGIDFNGVLHLNELIDNMQLVPGAKSPWATVLRCDCKADSDAVWTTVTESYDPLSGWFELVPVGNTVGLDTVIEYVAV